MQANDPQGTARPAHIPEKFWDPATQSVRTEALVKAYADLQRHMNGMVRVPGQGCSDDDVACFRRAMDIPDDADGYDIQSDHPMLAPDPNLNRRLHDAGFTRKQAQLIYDLAHERVIPALDAIHAHHQTGRHLDRLRDHFGGEVRWGEVSRQLSAWGQANLPEQVFQAMASSPEGVMAMEKMMRSGEPAMGRMAAPKEDALSEVDLKKMMQDPRYWKKRDPAFIEKVSAGFRKLAGEG